MASVKLVTNRTKTVVRRLDMTGHSTNAVDQAADSMTSIIWDDRDILHVEVDYNGCNDSKTIEGNT